MELFVRVRDGHGWRRTRGACQGLLDAVALCHQVLIRSQDPNEELGEIVSAIRLFRRAGGDADRVRVDGAYPSALWVESVRSAGVRHLSSGEAEPALSRGVCPALEGRRCSNRYEEGALPEADLRQRCLGDWPRCPSYVATPLER